MKLIDKDALLAEIDKLQLCTMDEHMNYYSAEAQGEYNALSKLESFLDTLEVKEFQKNNLFIVTRCEEHSDYVEKVFFSKEKAKEYCKQFEGNEDAYGRDITEIKVDYPTLKVKAEDELADTFIEKACSWLKNHYRDYMHNPTGKRLEAFFGGDLCNDFEDYMKGE